MANEKENNYIVKHFDAYRKNSDYFLYNTKFFIESMAKEHDYRIQERLLRELITKFSLLERELEQKINEITAMSITDQLTKIYNRHKITEELQMAVEIFKRYKHKFSVALFDIDHFKKVNDNHGHDAGDAVLKSLAKNVKAQLRTTDIFGRWGGEEFIIIFLETEIESAAATTEKVRKMIEETDEENVVKITCSFGVVEVNDQDCIDRIVKRADELLYTAKESGRNRVKF